MRYSVNIGMIFSDFPIDKRISLVQEAGFRAIESFWPQPDEVEDFIGAVEELEMHVALINAHEGDYRKGERGFAAHPGRRSWWRDVMDEAFELASRVECPNLNVLTGYLDTSYSHEEQHACLIENLAWAAPKAADHGISLLLEPLNAKTHPGYLCTTVMDAVALISEVGSPAVGMQFDCYQTAGGEGDVLGVLQGALKYVRHIQIADLPGRGAPGTGALNFAEILATIDQLPYDGYVGLEYTPTSQDPFAWIPVHER